MRGMGFQNVFLPQHVKKSYRGSIPMERYDHLPTYTVAYVTANAEIWPDDLGLIDAGIIDP